MNHTFGCIDSGSVRTRLILPYGQYVAQYASLVPMNHPTPYITLNFHQNTPLVIQPFCIYRQVSIN